MNTLMTKEKAEEIAAILNAEAQSEAAGWEYKAIHDPKGTGLSFVEVYDETGLLLGNL